MKSIIISLSKDGKVKNTFTKVSEFIKNKKVLNDKALNHLHLEIEDDVKVVAGQVLDLDFKIVNGQIVK